MSKTIKIAAGDIFRNGRGGAEYVDGINKHAQDLAYHQMTPFDEEKNIGNELINTESPLLTSEGAAMGFIGNKIRESVARFGDHQDELGSIVADDERLGRIRTLRVKRYPAAPLAYVYYLVTETVSGQTTESAKLVDLTQQQLPEGWLQSLNEPEYT